MIYKNGFLIPNNKRKRNQLQQTHDLKHCVKYTNT